MMQKISLVWVWSVVFMVLSTLWGCGTGKVCKDCKTVPQNFRVIHSNATQIDFRWQMYASVNLPYLLTLEDQMTHQRLEVSLPASVAQTFSLQKAQYPAFFQANHLYKAFLQVDCRKMKGCEQSGMSAPSNEGYLWHVVTNNGLSQPNVKGGGCFGNLSWSAVQNADKYLIHIFDNNAVLVKTDSTTNTQYDMQSAALDTTQLYLVQVQAKRMTPTQYSPPSPIMIICCIIVIEEQVEIANHLAANAQRTPLPSLAPCNSACNGLQQLAFSGSDGSVNGSFSLNNCADTDFWRLYFRPTDITHCTPEQSAVYVFGEEQTNGQIVKANIRVPAGGDVLQYSVTAPDQICPSIEYHHAVLPFTGRQGCP